jgi:hypothetical protein
LIQHAEAPGLYRSDDGGERWTHVCDSRLLISRAWYYMHVHADTQDPDTVYVNNLSFWKSTDAGSTFAQIDTPHGDNHDLWISPVYNKRMIQGNDGGANVSFNTGKTWAGVSTNPPRSTTTSASTIANPTVSMVPNKRQLVRHAKPHSS